MTKKEILEKLEKLSPEQKDFVVGEIKKHSPKKEKDSQNKETIKQKPKNNL